MSDYQPVSCALIERLELASLQRRVVTVTLHDHTRHSGRVLDVETRADKSEWLLLASHDAETPLAFRLDTIVRVDSVTER